MKLQEILAWMKKVKELGFRPEESAIPVPTERSRHASVPLDENFADFVDGGDSSFHALLLLSDFPYSPKGAFAFSALSAEIAADAKIVRKEGGSASVRRFGRKKSTFEWAEDVENAASDSEIAALLDAIQKNDAKFGVHSDGKTVKVFIRFAGDWRKMASMSFREGIWPTGVKKFVAVYTLGTDVYGNREFNPSLGNLAFAATAKGEYGWIEEEYEVSQLEKAGRDAAGIYAEEMGLEDSKPFVDFLVLSALLKHGSVAWYGGRKLYASEFFANVPYMLARAEDERTSGDMDESLFFLRTASDLCMLGLRCAPMEGRMLELAKHFDSMENMGAKKFIIQKNVAGMLLAAGIGVGEGGEITLRKGEDYTVHDGRLTMEFGKLVAALYSAGFFESDKAGNMACAEFWKSLRSKNAALFLASYGNGASLSLLDADVEVRRGSDVLKVEQFGSKLVTKRAMAWESGKAKEIKAHLAKIIEISDMRSVDESNRLGEIGSWGEAVYEISSKEGKGVLAFVSSKRFY